MTIQTDASSTGLGACLIQENTPIAYASRALTSTEQGYAQIEKELLAVVFGCHKFRSYVYGKQITIHSDHKPLETIVKKPLAQTPLRLQRMLLRLQSYDIKLEYIPGKNLLIADALSRAHLTSNSHDNDTRFTQDDIEVMVHAMVESLPMSPKKKDEFRRATKNDKELVALLKAVTQGWPINKRTVPDTIRKYWPVRNEIFEADGLLMIGHKVIVPAELRQEMLTIIHEGHLGIEKCKMRARQGLYWHKMNDDIEATVLNCKTCARFGKRNRKEPLKPHAIPEKPWEKVGADIMTFRGRDYLVVVDYYSKYPEIVPIEAKTAFRIILAMKSIFARFGIPRLIFSDNMPFSSRMFHDFARHWQIDLQTSSPGYPKSNGMVERSIQTIKQLLRKAQYEGKDPYLALLNFRTSPLSGIEQSPAEIMFGRPIKTKMPLQFGFQQTNEEIKRKLMQKQAKQKMYYDRGSKPLDDLEVGQKVYMRKEKCWLPSTITDILPAPRSYEVENDATGIKYRRNGIEVKPANNEEMQTDFRKGKYESKVNNKKQEETKPGRPSALASATSVEDDATGDESKTSTTDEDAAKAIDKSTRPTYVTKSGREVKAPDRYHPQHSVRKGKM